MEISESIDEGAQRMTASTIAAVELADSFYKLRETQSVTEELVASIKKHITEQSQQFQFKDEELQRCTQHTLILKNAYNKMHDLQAKRQRERKAYLEALKIQSKAINKLQRENAHLHELVRRGKEHETTSELINKGNDKRLTSTELSRLVDSCTQKDGMQKASFERKRVKRKLRLAKMTLQEDERYKKEILLVLIDNKRLIDELQCELESLHIQTTLNMKPKRPNALRQCWMGIHG